MTGRCGENLISTGDALSVIGTNADDKAGTITKAHGQQPDNEIVAELGGAVLLEVLGHETDSDRGGAWQYIKRYAEKAKLDPVAACQRLLNRVCVGPIMK